MRLQQGERLVHLNSNLGSCELTLQILEVKVLLIEPHLAS